VTLVTTGMSTAAATAPSRLARFWRQAPTRPTISTSWTPRPCAAGATCTLNLAFVPMSQGPHNNALLAITDNSSNVPGATQTIALSCTKSCFLQLRWVRPPMSPTR
jgi:hypothetical protein